MTSTPPPEPPVPPVRRREILAWCGYDFANSSFATIIVTVVFSVYFTKIICAGNARADGYWGLGALVSQLTVVLLSPFLGALIDLRAWKKQALFAAYLVCVVFTFCLSRFGPGDIVPALLCFVGANIAFSLGENFNASFLPELAPPSRIGRISGYGWAMGYVGGLGSLLLCFPLLKGGFTLANEANLRHTSALTALFFLVSAIPTFLFLRDRARPQPIGPAAVARATLRRTWETTRRIVAEPVLRTFFGAFFLYSCGIAVVVTFAAIYAEREIGFTGAQLIFLFIILQVSSSLGAFFFGFVQDKWGSILTLRLTLLLWVVVILGAISFKTVASFYIVGNIAGLAIGSAQSASRAVVGLLAPPERHAEYFGFWGLFWKLAAGFGPLTYGLISSATHSATLALLSTLVFFLSGLWLLGGVRLPGVPTHEGQG